MSNPKNEDYEKASSFIIISLSFLIMIAIIFIAIFFLNSCTLSFQNISTHGMAEDLVDENQTTSPKISPNINLKSV